jgi:Helix-turn-helix domain
MPDEGHDLRPETYALDSLIQATIRHAQRSPGTQDAMLFMGNGHQAFPIRVVRDPILEPVDKLVWMVIMLQARDTGGRAAFPSHGTLARQANIKSTSTIARAIAILRLTRWLSLCARLRAKTGQFRGNIYALHDEPLPLADALYLDEHYMAFTQQSRQNGHGRVRKVAQAVLDALSQEIGQGQDPLAPVAAIEQRARAVLTSREREPAGRRDKQPRPFAEFTDDVLQQLANQPEPLAIATAEDQDQNSNAVNKRRVEGCSSSNTLKTTTTTTHNSTTKFGASCKPPLTFPARLSDNQKALAKKYLAKIPGALHQPLLDELIGRLQAESFGAKPLYDELRFLHALCRAAKRGEFVPNLGIKVTEARARSHAQNAPVQKPPPPRTSPADSQAAQQAAREHLGLMRQHLGLPPAQ